MTGAQLREEKNCVPVTRTVCTQESGSLQCNCNPRCKRFKQMWWLDGIVKSRFYIPETMDLRLCTVEYSSSHVDTEATVVDVNFSQECRSQMISFFIQISSSNALSVKKSVLCRVFSIFIRKRFNFLLVSFIFYKLSTFTFSGDSMSACAHSSRVWPTWWWKCMLLMEMIMSQYWWS